MADETGAPAPQPNPTPAPTPNPVPPPQPTPAPTVASLSDEALRELASLRAEKAEREHNARIKAEQDRIDHEQRLIEKGKFEEALKSRDQAIAEARSTAEQARREKADFDTRVRKAEASRSLAVALARPELVEGVGELLHKNWADEFETVDAADGSFTTRHKVTGEDPKAFVAAQLATPKYAFAVKAGNRGGVNPGGGTPAPTAAAQHVSPQDRITQQLKAIIAGGRGSAPGLAGDYGGLAAAGNNAAPGLSGNYGNN